LRTRLPAESKKTIVSGTSVFFIQKPPVVVPGKTKSIPSFGAVLRFMSPRARCAGVLAISGRKVTPSSRSTAVARSDAPAMPAPATVDAIVRAAAATTKRKRVTTEQGRRTALASRV
jgi:hypothetical protein